MLDSIQALHGIMSTPVNLVPALEYIKEYSTWMNSLMKHLDRYDFQDKVKKVREKKRLKNKRRNRS